MRWYWAPAFFLLGAAGTYVALFRQVRTPPLGMAYVRAGSFEMGSNARDDMRPIHRVQLPAFYLDLTEVTAGAYNACVRAGLCDQTLDSEGCNGATSARPNHPINCVDFYHAETYCRWQKKRLPSEEEWEYAARGPDRRKYPWGDAAPKRQACWSGAGRTIFGTCAVGSHPGDVSPFGLLDMAGNVTEWTASGFSASYAKARKSEPRVLRGGGWGDADPDELSTVLRARRPADHLDGAFGFRCARSVRW